MIKENNAEILSEMINTNESKQSLISKNIVERQKREVEELAEKIKLSLDLFLRDYGENEKKKKIVRKKQGLSGENQSVSLN